MKRTRTTEIIVETDEVFVLRLCSTAAPVRCWCAVCEMEVEMITPETFAFLAGVGARVVYRLIETGQLHFTETPDGSVLICPNSLRAQAIDIQPQLKGETNEDELYLTVE